MLIVDDTTPTAGSSGNADGDEEPSRRQVVRADLVVALAARGYAVDVTHLGTWAARFAALAAARSPDDGVLFLTDSRVSLRRAPIPPRGAQWMGMRVLDVARESWGVDTTHFAPSSASGARVEAGLPDDAFVVGLVGFTPARRLDVTLRAVARARQRGAPVHVLAVGAGAHRGRAEALVRQLGLEGHATLRGPVTDLVPYLTAMDLVLDGSEAPLDLSGPSPSGGCSLGVLEAMACGVPAMGVARWEAAGYPIVRSSAGRQAARAWVQEHGRLDHVVRGLLERWGMTRGPAAVDERLAWPRRTWSLPAHRARRIDEGARATGGRAPWTVHVVMPTHNRAGFLRESVGSVRAQTYPHWTLVVVDDGSDDDTAQRVAAMGAEDGRVTYVRNRRGAGPAGARNQGLEDATADLVAFLDSDDRWAPDKLARQVDVFDRRGDVGLVASDYTLVRDGGQARARDLFAQQALAWAREPIRRSVRPWEALLDDPDEAVQARPYLDSVLCGLGLLHTSNVLVDRTLLLDPSLGLRGPFDEEWRRDEDVHLWLRLLPHTRAALLPQDLSTYDARGFAASGGPRYEGSQGARRPSPRGNAKSHLALLAWIERSQTLTRAQRRCLCLRRAELHGWIATLGTGGAAARHRLLAKMHRARARL